MFKKLFMVFATVLGLGVLAACGETTTGTTQSSATTTSSQKPGSQTTTTEALDPFWDADGNGVEDWTETPITITYGSWMHTDPEEESIESLMVREFTKKYPNVKVEMKIVGQSGEWDEKMNELFEADDLPDVFLVNRLENFVSRGMMANITEMYNHDPDTEYIFDSVKDLGVYKGKRYVIPTFIYPQFWIVNTTLLEERDIKLPSYDWTWDQMEDIARAVRDDTKHYIGVYGTEQYFYEYHKVIAGKDSGLYAFGFDGEKFDFTTPAYKQAMADLEVDLMERHVVNAVSPEEAALWYGNEEIDPRYAGYVGIWREASWSVKDKMPNFNFDFDIYPAPGGVGMGNTDIAAVSATCKNKQAAYQLLKWLSYSEEGILKRYELYEKYGDELAISGNNYPYPIVDYGYNEDGENLIWEAIPYGKTAPGLVSYEFVEALKHAAIQANKEVVGWDSVADAVRPYLNNILNQDGITYEGLVDSVQNDADFAFKDRRDYIDNLMNK